MITGKLDDLRTVIDGSPLSDKAGSAKFSGLSIDSRTIAAGNLFVAVKGEADDGHKYLPQAYEKGAGGFVIEAGYENRIPPEIKDSAIVVKNTQLGLRRIAVWWKQKFNPRIVALTGTNGKTTTKEMIADVLACRYNVFRTPGNLNNLYGIPLSLALLNDSYQVCVLELGMSYPGEIETLTKMVDPDFALITNIGPAHLETMGSIENIARAKFEILENLKNTAVRILNLDDPVLRNRYEHEPDPKISFAVRENAAVKPGSYSSNSLGRIIFEYEKESIHLRIPGMHTLYNALAACALGRLFEVDASEIKSALEKFTGRNSRMQILSLGGITVIDDSYNANPTSMGYALKTLHDMEGSGRKIAVLGDMKELGRDEAALHQQVGQITAELKIDYLITVGRLGMHIASQANLDGFEPTHTETLMSAEEAVEVLLGLLKEGDQVLIKASRAMAFEKIVTALKKQYQEES